MPGKPFDIDYDLWANRQWLAVLPKFQDQEAAQKVMTHILFAQWAWLRRAVAGTKADVKIPPEPLEASEPTVLAFHKAWKSLLTQVPDRSAVIKYNTFKGDSFENSIEEIYRHLLNHGTYHRGQLRALAEAESLDFPETDYIFYARADN